MSQDYGELVREAIRIRLDNAVRHGTSRAYVYRIADLNRFRPDLAEAVAAGTRSLGDCEREACDAGVLAIVEKSGDPEAPHGVRRGDTRFRAFKVGAAAWAMARDLNRANV